MLADAFSPHDGEAQSTNSPNTAEVAAEQIIKDGLTPDEIRQRAFEIHVENGGIYGCDFDDWLQAGRELQEKHRNEQELKKQ
jgi:hypothetical protein